MFCLKCGKEISEKQVFCEECLAEMEKHPVKPDTKIFLPRTTTPSAVKKNTSRRKNLSPEERILRMKKAIQLLCLILTVTLLSLVLAIFLLVESLSAETPQETIGQNYGTIGVENTDR